MYDLAVSDALSRQRTRQLECSLFSNGRIGEEVDLLTAKCTFLLLVQ